MEPRRLDASFATLSACLIGGRISIARNMDTGGSGKAALHWAMPPESIPRLTGARSDSLTPLPLAASPASSTSSEPESNPMPTPTNREEEKQTPERLYDLAVIRTDSTRRKLTGYPMSH